jgi:hypothetical protein
MTKVQQTRLSALFLLFCLAIQCITVWGINAYVDKKDTNDYILSESNHATLHADHQYADFSNSLFQSSTEPIPEPFEPEEKDSEEHQDDDEWSKFQFSFLGDFDFIFKSYDVTLSHFEQNVLRRTKISLVVLHHSWKSFLS